MISAAPRVIALGHALAYVWTGPADLPRSLKVEWRFIAVRWLGIVFMAPGLPLTHLPREQMLEAYMVLALATVYNGTLFWAMPRRPGLFANGYVTAICDALLNVAMVSVGGGFGSPFYYILFTVTISAAMRYGFGPSMAMAGVYVGLDAIEALRPGGRDLDGAYFFRSGFLIITAVLASYLREQANRAEQALQVRLHQARLLNESTAALGASLEYDAVLSAISNAAVRLVNGSQAVLVPAEDRDDEPASAASARLSQRTSFEVRRALLALCHAALQRPLDQPIIRQTLPNGDAALLFRLEHTHVPLGGVLAVAFTARGDALPVSDEVLASFRERITLALENASLYRRLARRTTDLQGAYSDLEQAHLELLTLDEMKTNFLANVSHELRTPLTSIRAFSEILLDYDDEQTRKEFLGIINSESERLTRLVNDVLDLTKIESGHMDWQMADLDVAEVLGDVARGFRPVVEQAGLAFRLDVAAGLRVQADRDRIQQVVTNLLSNAMKFTQHGSIGLQGRQVGESVEIAVVDTGVGIPAGEIERVFEKFQQVGDTLTDKPKGTGLGLAICRDIVQHHGGRIWAESTPGQGSRFTFTLPAIGTTAPAAGQDTGEPRPGLVAA